ncbi:MAG: GIY-YIG nuclease family protein, partial [Proteobacteria bacterium]|nr:GIY-YIG nuclease family protein [Pseudomonadota bacterium]
MKRNSVYYKYGIYGIRNRINDKLYIGKTMVSFGDRWDCHKAQLRANYHDNKHLQYSWNKYVED